MVSLLPLSLQDIQLHKRGKRLLGPLSFRLEATAGITLVLGPNGTGKTSLLRLMAGLERPSHGTRLWAVPQAQAFRAQAFVFQTPTLMRRSVLDNAAYPLRLDGLGRKAAQAAAYTQLETVGLEAHATKPAWALSGGERQKLALARALIRNPQLLYLDEPCSNLDGRATREFEALLADLRAQGLSLVMTTHDLGQARRLATSAHDQVVFLHAGQVLEQSQAATFFSTPQSGQARAYLNGDIVE